MNKVFPSERWARWHSATSTRSSEVDEQMLPREGRWHHSRSSWVDRCSLEKVDDITLGAVRWIDAAIGRWMTSQKSSWVDRCFHENVDDITVEAVGWMDALMRWMTSAHLSWWRMAYSSSEIHFGNGVKDWVYIFESDILLCVVCVCMCLLVVCVCEHRHPRYSEALDSLELELQKLEVIRCAYR